MAVEVRPGQSLTLYGRYWQGAPVVSDRYDMTGRALSIVDCNLPFVPSVAISTDPDYDFVITATATQTAMMVEGQCYECAVRAYYDETDCLVTPSFRLVAV